jgi:hypothetical protein
MQNIHQRRRSAWYSWPLILIVAIAAAWLFIDDIQGLIIGLRNQAPVLYIQSGVVILPLFSISTLFFLLIDIVRCIPNDKLADKLEFWFLGLILATIFLFPVVMIVGLT